MASRGDGKEQRVGWRDVAMGWQGWLDVVMGRSVQQAIGCQASKEWDGRSGHGEPEVGPASNGIIGV